MAAPTTSRDTADLPTKDDGKEVADTGKSPSAAVPPKKRASSSTDQKQKKKKHLKLDAAKVKKPAKEKKAPKLNPDGSVVVKRRAKNGTRAVREIKFEQRNSGQKNAMAWAPFKRLVYEVAHDIDPKLRFKKAAVEALREEAQAHMVRLFSITNSMVLDRTTRKVINHKDLMVANAIAFRPEMWNAGIRDTGSLLKNATN